MTSGAATLLIVGLVSGAITLIATLSWHRWRFQRIARHADVLRGKRHEQMLARFSETAALDRSRRRYWELFQHSTAPMLITKPEGRIVAANEAMAQMLGYRDEAELKRCNAADLYADPRERELKTRAPLEAHGRIRNGQLKLKRKDGTLIDVLVSVRRVQGWANEQYYEGVCTDISELRRAAEERRRMESQLYLARKLGSVGQLAAGIAHEINTPIQFVGDNVHFLRDAYQQVAAVLQRYREAFGQLALDRRHAELSAELARFEQQANLSYHLGEIPKALDSSFEGVHRVSEIVAAMKEFAHPGDAERSATDLNQSLQTTLVVARNEYKQFADVETDFGELPAVMCRRGEINKLFLNLIVNAAHAIQSVSGEGSRRGVIAIATRHDAEHVTITIRDTGCGIPKALLSRIFDPFFTTKPLGKGTGQGLAIARTIVENHGGHLDVESTPGQGTSFTIRLPLATEQDATPADGAFLAVEGGGSI